MTPGTEWQEETKFLLEGRLRDYIRRAKDLYDRDDVYVTDTGLREVYDGLWAATYKNPELSKLRGERYFLFVFTKTLNITNLLQESVLSVENRVQAVCGGDGWECLGYHVIAARHVQGCSQQMLILLPDDRWQRWQGRMSRGGHVTVVLTRDEALQLVTETKLSAVAEKVLRALKHEL